MYFELKTLDDVKEHLLERVVKNYVPKEEKVLPKEKKKPKVKKSSVGKRVVKEVFFKPIEIPPKKEEVKDDVEVNNDLYTEVGEFLLSIGFYEDRGEFKYIMDNNVVIWAKYNTNCWDMWLYNNHSNTRYKYKWLYSLKEVQVHLSDNIFKTKFIDRIKSFFSL